MPVVAMACPPDKPTYGETHHVKHCITKCKSKCYSPFLMAAIYSANQRNHHRGRYL